MTTALPPNVRAFVRRGPSLLLAFGLLAATWAPRTEVQAAEGARQPTPAHPAVSAVPMSVVQPVEVPSAPPGPVLAPSVITHHPDVLVELDAVPTKTMLNSIEDRRDVEYMVGARRFDATLESGNEILGADEETVSTKEPLAMLAVDPVSFRPMTPEVTAQSVAVWERLAAGDAVISHDVAFQRGLALGDTIVVRTDKGQRSYRIGALATSGRPAIADVIVTTDGSGMLAPTGPNVLLIAASDGTGPVWLGEQLINELGDGRFERLDRAGSDRVPGWAGLETFSYVDTTGGRIQILGDWTRRFIVTVDLPILGRTRCNRLMVPQLVAALNDVAAAGLSHLIDPSQFGGCWVPRHIDWNPNRPLSMHAWGLAVDFNVSTNGLGQTPTMDMRIVRIFERWGFWWGGWWERPDGMHFQLDRFITVD